MAWPIPAIPEQPVLSPPRYGIWFAVLIVILTIGTLSALFIGNITAYGQLLLYGTLPGLLFWMCLFGVVLNRYEQSSASARAWYEETEQTKAQWQQWSRAQLAVVGNVLLTPEAEGMGTLLGELKDIPLYPQKARPLSGAPRSLSAHLHEIDSKLERQCPGYRHHVQTVYMLHAPTLHRESMISAVFSQWDLVPDTVEAIEHVPALQQASECSGVILLLCLQHWPDRLPQPSSELISAQLITSPAFARAQALPVMAGLGRLMPLLPEKLSDDLDMLFDYTRLEKKQIQHVWLSGYAETTPAEIALYADTRQWMLPQKQPVHLLDLSFGPPGALSFGVSLAMMVDAVGKTAQNQLIISQTPQSSGWLCLVTSELFS
ncbi:MULTISPECIES: hypothetical protein [unclassified Serratia (in: enterobacteria)]|uniref:hypothetical protein n=1 Tax=unclassified Serratia (in: enterobacteria) TaxID=2647522 RepID=UPI000501545C|nr:MULTISPECIES: hypothetical protein [unclassified Serratia (in: enterobacteria)]KFK91888.1 hypothetical protein JV45_23805 [Serratia sp. Ag2]KFK94114.1 hypothetical protein IV04_22920 [Serratia sp. Ag1]